MQRRKIANNNNDEKIIEISTSSKTRQKRTKVIVKFISILLIITGLLLISKSIKKDAKHIDNLELSLEKRDETDLTRWNNAYKKSSSSSSGNSLVDKPKVTNNILRTGKSDSTDSASAIASLDQEEQKTQIINLESNAVSQINNPPSKVNHPPNPVLLSSKEIEIKLNPKSGKHTYTNNAIFGFAQGYTYDIYVTFLESLKLTGYSEDVVLSVSADVSQETLDYLATFKNVIVYKDEWDCQGFMRCKVTHLYFKDGKVVDDPRPARPVATARYELYYAWSLQYSEESWIILIDFRDTYFQRNPFENLNSSTPPALMLFEENLESVDLGRSSFNSRWLKSAYGQDIEKKVSFSNPVICSGSTIGSNVYIQIYLKGMIQEYDDTHCNLKGCDQGFHNYLYYSSKLSNWIPNIEVFKQGEGLINNLAAMRTKPLKEWNILDENYAVLNWDKSLSVIVHQYDRDGELSSVWRKVKRKYMQQLKQAK